VTGGLDVEINPIYKFQVEARDQMNAELFDTAEVVIRVTDINDNSPSFTEVRQHSEGILLSTHRCQISHFPQIHSHWLPTP